MLSSEILLGWDLERDCSEIEPLPVEINYHLLNVLHQGPRWACAGERRETAMLLSMRRARKTKIHIVRFPLLILVVTTINKSQNSFPSPPGSRQGYKLSKLIAKLRQAHLGHPDVRNPPTSRSMARASQIPQS